VSILASPIFVLCFRTGRGGVRAGKSAVVSHDTATESDADGSVATSPPPSRGASKENTRPSEAAATEGTRSKTAAAAKKKNTKKTTVGSGIGATEPAQGRGLSR
jgi:hypothetical protein